MIDRNQERTENTDPVFGRSLENDTGDSLVDFEAIADEVILHIENGEAHNA